MRPRSVYVWGTNGPRDLRAVRLLAGRLKGIGTEQVLVKAFGDLGDVWIEGRHLPSYANPQWSPAWLQPYRDLGLEVTPWGYPWPDHRDIEACVEALEAVWCDEVILNPESEWRVHWASSPYNTLAEANRYARDWVRRLKARCQEEFGKVPRLGLSSCPTWADFPYEGFMEECDFALPEHYFPDNEMAPDGETGHEAGEDMVEAHIRRAGRDKPCYVVVTACGEYKDGSPKNDYEPYSVVGLARNALGDMPDLDGFCAWEAGNGAFQADAVAQVFALVPQLVAQTPKPLDLPYNIAENPAVWHCGLTDKWVVEPAFLDRYRSLGDKAIEVLGLPITGQDDTIQYFERARMERQPDGRVTLGLLGTELLAARAEIETLKSAPKVPKKVAKAS